MEYSSGILSDAQTCITTTTNKILNSSITPKISLMQLLLVSQILPPPQLLETLFCSLFCLVSECCVNGIIQYAVLCISLLSLSIMHLKFTQVVACINISSFYYSVIYFFYSVMYVYASFCCCCFVFRKPQIIFHSFLCSAKCWLPYVVSLVGLFCLLLSTLCL